MRTEWDRKNTRIYNPQSLYPDDFTLGIHDTSHRTSTREVEDGTAALLDPSADSVIGQIVSEGFVDGVFDRAEIFQALHGEGGRTDGVVEYLLVDWRLEKSGVDDGRVSGVFGL